MFRPASLQDDLNVLVCICSGIFNYTMEIFVPYLSVVNVLIRWSPKENYKQQVTEFLLVWLFGVFSFQILQE